MKNINIDMFNQLWGGSIYGFNSDFLTHKFFINVKTKEKTGMKFYLLDFSKVSEIHYKNELDLSPAYYMEFTSIDFQEEGDRFIASIDIWSQDNVIKIVCEKINIELIAEDDFGEGSLC